ncbi:MAG: magnesium transporter CorA family protein [Burkholderiaceae bacterium]
MAESTTLPVALSPDGFVWVTAERVEFETGLTQLQADLARLTGTQLVDLHVQDLLSRQLPSQYDYTSQYDLLVFRRLAAQGDPPAMRRGAPASAAPLPGALLPRIDTTPVGFVVFDRVLLSVHPAECAVRNAFIARLSGAAPPATNGSTDSPALRPAAVARSATSPADLMLRLVNLMVDGFLELRRELTQQLDHWQAELLNPKSRAIDWSTMLDVRLALHELDQICEDQRAAVQDWTDTVETWPDAATQPAQRERDLLLVRSRDLLEHIERVVHHVRRLEQSAETAVQMHFSAQSNRTNDIMRVLTVLTAVFLPLNLIAGIFGMNFESIPLLHKAAGFWIAMGAMAVIAVALVVFFWRKRYLERTR